MADTATVRAEPIQLAHRRTPDGDVRVTFSVAPGVRRSGVISAERYNEGTVAELGRRLAAAHTTTKEK